MMERHLSGGRSNKCKGTWATWVWRLQETAITGTQPERRLAGRWGSSNSDNWGSYTPGKDLIMFEPIWLHLNMPLFHKSWWSVHVMTAFSESNCCVTLQMLSTIQKLKKHLISYVTDHRLEFCCFNMLIMSITVLPFECPGWGCSPKVCRCLPSGMVSLPGDSVGGPGGLLEEELILCALRIPPPHFSWIAISFYFSLGTEALAGKEHPHSVFLLEAILEVPLGAAGCCRRRFHNTFKVSLLKTVTSGEP